MESKLISSREIALTERLTGSLSSPFPFRSTFPAFFGNGSHPSLPSAHSTAQESGLPSSSRTSRYRLRKLCNQQESTSHGSDGSRLFEKLLALYYHVQSAKADFARFLVQFVSLGLPKISIQESSQSALVSRHCTLVPSLSLLHLLSTHNHTLLM